MLSIEARRRPDVTDPSSPIVAPPHGRVLVARATRASSGANVRRRPGVPTGPDRAARVRVRGGERGLPRGAETRPRICHGLLGGGDDLPPVAVAAGEY